MRVALKSASLNNYNFNCNANCNFNYNFNYKFNYKFNYNYNVEVGSRPDHTRDNLGSCHTELRTMDRGLGYARISIFSRG